MEQGNGKPKSLGSELTFIEDELNAIWKLLSGSERQKREVVRKMNRVRMTLHRLKYSGEAGTKPLIKTEC